METLPNEVLAHLVAICGLKHRLQACALINKRFHGVCTAASSKLAFREQQWTSSASSWIDKYGSVIEQLSLRALPEDVVVRALPCPNLQSLHLRGCQVQLAPTAEHRGVLADCKQLTHLEVSYSTVRPVADELACLASLIDLKHLDLTAVLPEKPDTSDASEGSGTGSDSETSDSSDEVAQETALLLPADVLFHLQKLTYLYLAPQHVCDAALQHLSTLADLQDLIFTFPWDYKQRKQTSPAALAGLGTLQRLTALQLDNIPFRVSVDTTPGLPKLSALRKLRLQLRYDGPDVSSIDPAVLAALPQLQDLDLSGVTGCSEQQVLSLLQPVCSMQQLSSLHISSSGLYCPTPAAYSSLTTTSALQSLHLSGCRFPLGAWQRMFPAGKQLLRLQSFKCKPLHNRYNPTEMLHKTAAEQPSAADVHALASSCPQLQCLELSCYDGPLNLSGPSQLSGLTSLVLDDAWCGKHLNLMLEGIAQLTTLQMLRVNHEMFSGTLRGLEVNCLMQLTALQQLTKLELQGLGSSGQHRALATGASFFSQMHECHLHNRAPDGQPPDVWQQLKQRCETASQSSALNMWGMVESPFQPDYVVMPGYMPLFF